MNNLQSKTLLTLKFRCLEQMTQNRDRETILNIRNIFKPIMIWDLSILFVLLVLIIHVIICLFKIFSGYSLMLYYTTCIWKPKEVAHFRAYQSIWYVCMNVKLTIEKYFA